MLETRVSLRVRPAQAMIKIVTFTHIIYQQRFHWKTIRLIEMKDACLRFLQIAAVSYYRSQILHLFQTSGAFLTKRTCRKFSPAILKTRKIYLTKEINIQFTPNPFPACLCLRNENTQSCNAFVHFQAFAYLSRLILGIRKNTKVLV